MRSEKSKSKHLVAFLLLDRERLGQEVYSKSSTDGVSIMKKLTK